MIRLTRDEWWWHVCWKAALDEDEKHEGIHCFSSFVPQRDSNWQIVKAKYSTAHLPMLFYYSVTSGGVFLIYTEESLASLRSDIIPNCSINHNTFNAGWRACGMVAWGEWSVKTAAAHQWKPLDYGLPLLITPPLLALALRTVSNLIHLFWTRTPSLRPVLRIRSLLTFPPMYGPLCDPRGCFSTLFTAADHSAIKGISGTPSAPDARFQALPSLTTAMPRHLQDGFRSSVQETQQPGLTSLRILQWHWLMGFSRGEQWWKKMMCRIIWIEHIVTQDVTWLGSKCGMSWRCCKLRNTQTSGRPRVTADNNTCGVLNSIAEHTALSCIGLVHIG